MDAPVAPRGSWFTTSKIMMICSALASLAVVYFSLWHTTEAGQKADKLAMEYDIAKANAGIAQATGMAPPGWVGQAQAQVVARPQPAQQPQSPPVASNAIKRAEMFSCSTYEEKEQGFASASPQMVSQGESLRLSSGCAVVQVNMPVTKLSAQGYQLVVLDSAKPGYSFQCGDFPGNNNSVQECVDFINRHGQFWVIVQNSGYVFIN